MAHPVVRALASAWSLAAVALFAPLAAAQGDTQQAPGSSSTDRPAAPDTEKPGPKQGEIVQSDTLGMNMVSWNLDTHKTTTVADQAGLSEFVGAHYFFADRWRIGMNFQFTELLTTPPKGTDRFATFALLPQIGWHFYGPLFAAGVFTFAPRTRSSGNLDMGIQGVFGAGFKLARGVNLTTAVEVPYNFYLARTIGITPLAGLSIVL